MITFASKVIKIGIELNFTHLYWQVICSYIDCCIPSSLEVLLKLTGKLETFQPSCQFCNILVFLQQQFRFQTKILSFPLFQQLSPVANIDQSVAAPTSRSRTIKGSIDPTREALRFGLSSALRCCQFCQKIRRQQRDTGNIRHTNLDSAFQATEKILKLSIYSTQHTTYIIVYSQTWVCVTSTNDSNCQVPSF